MGNMETILLLFLQFILWPATQALFTVEVGSPSYVGEFGDSIIMECRFAPVDPNISPAVFWRRIQPEPSLNVYKMQNKQEDLTFQDAYFRGRVQQTIDMQQGRTSLEMSHLTINDNGTYQCLVEMTGADYKDTTLTVKVSYKSVKKRVKRVGKKVELSCSSHGFPLASIVWKDLNGTELKPSNVSVVRTPEQLFNITSRILVDNSTNVYTCSVMEKGSLEQSATFNIPEEIPVNICKRPRRSLAALVLIPSLILLVLVIYCLRKGKRRSSDPHNKERLITSSIALSTNIMESVRITLVASYSSLQLTGQDKQLTQFCEKELPSRLQKRDGQEVTFAALLPGVRDVVLLEGPPDSGKTTVAMSLAYAWAQSSVWDPFGVGQYPILLLVLCIGEFRDLFEMAALQLSSWGASRDCITAHSLRTVMVGPSGGLLVLDGYQEGCKELDTSLALFLQEREACGVLVTAFPGHCSHLNATTVLQLKP